MGPYISASAETWTSFPEAVRPSMAEVRSAGLRAGAGGGRSPAGGEGQHGRAGGAAPGPESRGCGRAAAGPGPGRAARGPKR